MIIMQTFILEAQFALQYSVCDIKSVKITDKWYVCSQIIPKFKNKIFK